jgi:hypothetical protein
VELVVDASFLVDIILNFRTAQYDAKGRLVTDRRRIARQYLRGEPRLGADEGGRAWRVGRLGP